MWNSRSPGVDGALCPPAVMATNVPELGRAGGPAEPIPRDGPDADHAGEVRAQIAEPDGLGQVVDRRDDLARGGEVGRVGADRDGEEHRELRERGIHLLGVDRHPAVRLLHAPAPSSRHPPLCSRWYRQARGGAQVGWSIVNHRTLVKQLAALPDGPVSVSGWVETVRDQKKVQFVILRDESGAVQLVNPATRELEPEDGRPRHRRRARHHRARSRRSRTGTFLTVTGELKHDERVKLGGVEVKIGVARRRRRGAPRDARSPRTSSLDKRMDWRFLDLRQRRSRTSSSASRPRSSTRCARTGSSATSSRSTPRSSWRRRRESRAELFEVELLRRATAYLAQSPQFFKQMAQPAGFGKVFEVGAGVPRRPVVHARGTRPSSRRIDAEISWIDSHEDVMRMHEELLVAGITAVKEKHGAEIEELFGIEVDGADDAVPAHPARRGEARSSPTAATRSRAPTTTWTPRASARSRRT